MKKNIPLRCCIVCKKLIPRNTKANEKRIRPAQYIHAKYCSVKCRGIWQSKNIVGKNHPCWKGGNTKCIICGKELAARYTSRDTKYCRKCWEKSVRGKGHWNWKDGKTPQNIILRGRIENKIWRLEVFERDDFTCQLCGDNKGGNLNAHHIKHWAKYPELRFNINNGITLCRECHIQIHKKYNK